MGGFRLCTDSTHLHFAESISIVTPIPRSHRFFLPNGKRRRRDQRLERKRRGLMPLVFSQGPTRAVVSRELCNPLESSWARQK